MSGTGYKQTCWRVRWDVRFTPHDRRVFHVRASEKGLEIYRRLDQLFGAHCEKLDAAQFTPENFEQADTTLRRLEQFWASPQHFTNRVTSVA